jgi:hypothetical protein
MTVLRPALSLFVLLAGAAAMAGPIIQPNEHYAKVGYAQAEKDIRACSSAARSIGASRAESRASMGGTSRDLFNDGGGRDPEFQTTVERCLSNKGYNVIGWD